MKLAQLAVPSVLVSAIFSAFAACSSSDDAPIAAGDAGNDVTSFGEAAPPKDDVEIPIGDTCGNPAGLATNASWAMRGGCPKRGGVFRSNGPDDAVIDWTFPMTGTQSTPVVDGSGLIWVGSSAGVTVLRRNGDVQSHFANGPVDSSGAVDTANRAFFATHEGTFYGLAQASPMVDGGPDAEVDDSGTAISRVISSKMIGDSGQSPAIGADGTIYIGTHDGKMNALSADLSTVKWSVSVGGDASATIADGVIYAGSTDKKVYAIDANGAVKWSFDTGDAIVAPVSVGGDDTVYAGSSDGKLYAIDPAGKLKWSYATGGPIKGTPAVLGGAVYVGSEDKKLHAVRSDTGGFKWAYATLGAVASPIIGKDGIVYAGSSDGHVYAVTPGGSLYFAVNVKGAVSGPPAFGGDGAMYVATNNALVAISR